MMHRLNINDLKYLIDHSDNSLAKAMLKHYEELEKQLANRDFDFLEGMTTEDVGTKDEL